MKVNIGGRGSIPGLGVLAPAYGIDMTKQNVRRLLNFQSFRVYQASTGMLITVVNIDDVFKNDNVVAVSVVKPVTKPVETKNPIISVSTTTDIPVDDDPYTGDKNGIGGLTPLIGETTVDVEEAPLPEITAENIDVEKVHEATEIVVDPETVGEPDVEEFVENIMSESATDDVVEEAIVDNDVVNDIEETVSDESSDTPVNTNPNNHNNYNRRKKNRRH